MEKSKGRTSLLLLPYLENVGASRMQNIGELKSKIVAGVEGPPL